MKVDVPDGRPGLHARPRHVTRHPRISQRERRSSCSVAIAISCRWPSTRSAVGRHRPDAEPVWIAEIQGLAYEVIGRPRAGTNDAEVGYEAAERRAIRNEDCEAIKADEAVARHRPRAAPLVQLDQRCTIVVRQAGDSSVPRGNAETKNVRVESERSGQVAYLEQDAPDVRLIRQSISTG